MDLVRKLIFGSLSAILTQFDKYRSGYYKYLYRANVSVAADFSLGRYSSIVIFPGGKNARLTIAERNAFRKFCTISLDADGIFTIGKGNFFNNYCSLTCLGKITIGENNIFGEAIKIYDHNHIFNKKDILIRDQGFKIGEVTIGNNCWIGSNCIILNNVTIGDNVVIGANNIVYQSIPSNTLVKANYTASIDGINFV